MLDTDAIQVLLAGRAGVYRVLQNAMGNEPSEEMLDQLSSESARQVFLLFDDAQTEYGKAVDALIHRARECKAGGGTALYALESGFARLFVGPNPPEAAPWESFYLSGESGLFHKITLNVRNVYRSQGLLPAAYPNVADDHLAIELDYLTRLAERAETFWVSGNSESRENVRSSLTSSEEFLQEHLIRWASKCADRISASKYANFYQEVAAVLVEFLPIDLAALNELKAELG